MNIFRNPIERLQITKPAFALFDIGLNHIALAALFDMPRAAFLQFGFNKVAFAAGKQISPQPRVQLIAQSLIAAYPAVFQHRGTDGVIFFAKPQTVFDCA